MAPDLSIVVLCYKTGKNAIPFVKKVVQEASSLTDNWEIILVGNYHRGDFHDDTPAIVQKIAAEDPQRIKSITLEKRGMMGWDSRKGLEQATGTAIALIDGDGQMPPSDLSWVYRKLKDEQLDMVKTYRTKRMDGFLRKLNSDAYNIIFRFLFPGFPVRDVNSKPKIFRKEFFNKLTLTSNDWFLDAEIMIQARRYKCRIGEVPTIFYESKDRKSFVRIKHILEFLINLLKARILEFFVKR